ncbi:MAG: hypothetical protein ACTSQA_00345 [Candidatus Heimdallarchaeaceae archaeon]
MKSKGHKYKKNCKICNKEINAIKEILGHKSKKGHSMQCTTSNQGVYFEEAHCWFCNECWELLWKHMNKQ